MADRSVSKELNCVAESNESGTMGMSYDAETGGHDKIVMDRGSKISKNMRRCGECGSVNPGRADPFRRTPM